MSTSSIKLEREASAMFGVMLGWMTGVDTNTVPSPQGAEYMAECESDDEEWDMVSNESCKRMACFGSIHLISLADSSYDDCWRATKPPSFICTISMNHARGWHAVAASLSFHWRIHLERIVGGLRSHL
eukprot:scaffold1521_cov271-Chaetoceros_neogracile.AAC.55